MGENVYKNGETAWHCAFQNRFANEVGLEQDSQLKVSLKDGKLVISSAAKSKLTLKRLLAQVTRDIGILKLIQGPAVGSEVW